MKHAIPKVELPGGSYTPVRVEHRIQPVTCANCGNTGLRYVHTIRHARIGEIQVGKICAGRLTGNPLAAEAGERACRFRETRRARWATRESEAGEIRRQLHHRRWAQLDRLSDPKRLQRPHRELAG